MPRSRSLVKAFDLIPVVEQVLPDRQKTEVRRTDRSCAIFLSIYTIIDSFFFPGACHLELIVALYVINVG